MTISYDLTTSASILDRRDIIIYDCLQDTSVNSWTIYDDIDLIALSNDGRILATRYNDTPSLVSLWNTREREIIINIRTEKYEDYNEITSFIFFPDGKNLVTGDNKGFVTLWNIDNGEIIDQKSHGANDDYTTIKSLSVSLDGNTLVSGDDNGIIKVWNVDCENQKLKLKQKQRIKNREEVEYMAISSDGQTLLSYSPYNNIRVWNLA